MQPHPPRHRPLPGQRRSSRPTLRVNVETLEHLMTMVSELVLTRNQLLEIARRHENSEFKVPLQRLSNVTAEPQEGVVKTRTQPFGNAWQKLLASCATSPPNLASSPPRSSAPQWRQAC